MGLLLNSRIVAYELGYVTVEEFIVQTEKTLSTLQRLEKYRGHWFNWYNTRTLQPEQPRFISTVDSGNLAACLLTLKQACLGISLQPISMDLLWQGLTDHVHLLLTLVSSVQLPKMPELQALEDFLRETGTWKTKHCLYGLAGSLAKLRDNCDNQLIRNSELTCVISETLSRINAIHLAFAEVGTGNRVTNNGFAQNAADVLPPSIKERLLRIVEQLEFMVSSMDFSFLSSARKGLLSVGYDYDRQMLHESSYDLLASEARTALFIAIAKGDLPVKTWLNLGRAHARIHNRNMLLSWAGTMFEYMMPNLWMKLFPGSLIEQTARSVVRIQSRFAKDLGMPWGLSEAACSEPAADGSYEYLAFGVRELSLRVCGPTQMAVSPYSSFLASLVDSKTSLENIRSIKEFAWQGRFGFYEAAVIAGSRSGSASRGKLVRCWMAHHQGMILLAICNLLLNFIVQDMFHCEPMIAASERILEEQFPPSARVDDSEKWRALMKKNRRKSRSSLTESPTKSCTKILIRM